MPKGMFIFTGDIQTGFVIKAKYPEELEISENSLKIISLSQTLREYRNFSIQIIGSSKIVSYYIDSKSNYFINVILADKEDPILFENILSLITSQINKNISNEKLKSFLPYFYNQISLYSSSDEEQKLAIAYSDELKRLIIIKLIEEANISKNELLKWLKEKLGVKDLAIDFIIDTLKELKLINISSSIETSEIYLFLINDFFITRSSPSNLIEKVNKKQIPRDIGNKYLKKVKVFFQNYSPTLENENKIIEVITDSDCYSLLKLLRLSPLSNEGLLKIGSKFRDIDTALKKLQSLGAVETIKDENDKEFYFLKTDLLIKRFFPEYLVEIILRKYNKKTTNESITTEHLNLLKNTYQLEIKGIKEKIEKGKEKLKEG